MTRKDYPLIAAALKAARTTCEKLYQNARSVCDANAIVLADALAHDNAGFDKDRFLRDAGVQPATHTNNIGVTP